MSIRALRSLLIAIVATVCAGVGPAFAITVPPGFTVDSVVPSTQFDTPTAIAFLPDGRLLVAEKSGLLWAVTNGVRASTPMWDGRNEVLDAYDRGFLGLAVDPHYTANHYLYLMYTVDPDSNGVDDNPASFGRIVRYQVSFTDSTQFAAGSRTVLLGTDWPHGPLEASPSHTIGSLRFGNDGTLLASTGDGAEFDFLDVGGNNPGAFLPGRTDPSEDLGTFRSQLITSLCGKVLRLDPSNGHGLPSNPYWDGDPTSVRSRVWAYGMRNPFRFTVRPGTGNPDPAAGKPGELIIGDVGWYTYEEHNVSAHGGENFGWPCYEGLLPTDQYNRLPQSATWLCDSLGTSRNPATTFTFAPIVTHHTTIGLSNPQFGIGNCAVGGAFYKGALYPSQFREKYFAVDFGQNWIKVVDIDSLGNLVSISDFADNAEGPVDMNVDPYTGDIVYVSIVTGQIRRIRWTGGAGGNLPPVAKGAATPSTGVAPLSVSFSSAGSFDSNGDTLSFSWNFGDGSGSPLPNPSHVYTIPGDYTATLTLDDHHGGVTSVNVSVSVAISADFPATGVLDDFNRPDGPIGGLWTGDIVNASIVSGHVEHTNVDNSMVLGTAAPFGATQEAFVRFTHLATNAPEQDLMLKVQGLSWDTGHIEVRYEASQNGVFVTTYSPSQSWVSRSPLIPATLQDGDQLGARAYPTGLVVIYKNGVLLGSADCSGWDFHANGGRIGMAVVGPNTSQLDDFGGGDVVLTANTPPTVQIQHPDTTWAVAGDTLIFASIAHDSQTPDSLLTYRWDIDVVHNNHVHPSVTTATTPSCTFVMINHDDGTGCYFLWKLKVTDTGNLTTRDSVIVFPEIDLAPSPIQLSPALPVDSQPLTLQFRERNLGRMPSHRHHWLLMLDGTVVASGDTLEAARDSVALSWTSSAPLAVGRHVAHVVLDTLSTGAQGQNVETNETNNAATLSFDVTAALAVGDGTPHVLALSNAWPNPAQGHANFTLDLPSTSAVEMTVHDLQGRAVWSRAEREYGAGRWTLAWPGTDAAGGRAPAGLYLVRIRAGGREFSRRFVLLP